MARAVSATPATPVAPAVPTGPGMPTAPAGTSEGRAGGRARQTAPTLRLERRLLRGGATRLAGMDEVGRGSPAGPVHVGVVVVDATTPPAPPGVRDSKLVVPAAREALVPRIRAWAAGAVGAASPAEVDAVGVTGALRLAGLRALAQLDVAPDLVLLDGVHDWLTGPAAGASDDEILPEPVRVVTRVRADRTCASVAAASILAKVARDAVMTGLSVDYPDYGWDANKGYGTADHLEALGRLGPTPHHRLTWRMPGPA